MWVLDPPGGYPGKTRFLGRPWAKVAGRDPEYVFLGIRQRFVARDRGQATGCDPHGCCRGTMWVPCRVGGYPGKNSFFRETVGTSVGGGCCDYV